VASHRSVKHVQGSTRRSGGAHRKRNSSHEPYQWLGVGAVAVGLGLTVVNGTGEAHADSTHANESPSSDGTQAGKAQASSTTNSPRRSSKSAKVAATNPPAANPASHNSAGTPGNTPRGKTPPGAHITAANSRGALVAQGTTSTTEASIPTSHLGVQKVAASARSVTIAQLTPAPVTPKSIVTDLLTWSGLGSLATGLPLPIDPVPDFIGSLWLGVRDVEYRWNNLRPTLKPTVASQDPSSGTVTGNLNGDDYEADNLTYTVTDGPHAGTLDIDPAGAFIYTPGAAIAATGGTDTFTVEIDDALGNPVHDHGLSGLLGLTGPQTATVTIAVTPIANRAPVFGNPVLLNTDNTTGVTTWQLNASDPDGGTVTYALPNAPDPVYATATLDPSTGELTFTPTDRARYAAALTDSGRTITFAVTATDGEATTTLNFPATVTPLHPDDDGTLDLADLDTLAEYGTVQVSEGDNGLIIAIIGTFTDQKITDNAGALETLNRVAVLLGADGTFDGDIAVRTTNFGADSGGVSEKVYRLTQSLNGLPVAGGDIILTTLADGTVTGVFSGNDTAIYGVDTAPDAGLDESAETEAAATQILLNSMGPAPTQQQRDAFVNVLSFDSKLVVYALDPNLAPALAWAVNVYATPAATDSDGEPVDTTVPIALTTYYIYANGANAGTLLAGEELTQRASTTTTVTASGLPHGSTPQTYTIKVQQNGNQFKMVDPTRSITIYRGQLVYTDWDWGTFSFNQAGVTPAGNVVTKGSGAWDPSAVSAMANMETVHDYYLNTLGWDFTTQVPNPNGIQVGLVNSISGGSVWQGGSTYLNFIFGSDGEAALDIVGHEYTHAVIESIVPTGTSFSGSQGNALDEAYGDIIGNLIEGKNDAGEWLVGEDAAGDPYRDMKNPGNFGDASTGEPIQLGCRCALQRHHLRSRRPDHDRRFADDRRVEGHLGAYLLQLAQPTSCGRNVPASPQRCYCLCQRAGAEHR
jgi:hypothetical protein